jgi:hypothetical protein
VEERTGGGRRYVESDDREKVPLTVGDEPRSVGFHGRATLASYSGRVAVMHWAFVQPA